MLYSEHIMCGVQKNKRPDKYDGALIQRTFETDIHPRAYANRAKYLQFHSCFSVEALRNNCKYYTTVIGRCSSHQLT